MREHKFRFWDTFDKKEPRMVYFNFGKLMGGSVYPDMKTVMQSTGLKDKNGKDVYEGDVLTSTIYPFQSDKEYNYHGEVSWGEEDAAFLLTKHVVNKNTRGISQGITDLLTDYDIQDFEIIGNIYENPELLITRT